MRNLISILFVLWPLTMSAFPEAAQRTCVINLRQIAEAKRGLQIAEHLPSGATCEPAALARFFPTLPRCPVGGVYNIGPIGTEPSCSVAGHSEAALQEGFRRQLARDRWIRWSLWAGGALALAGLGWRMWRSRTRKPAGTCDAGDGGIPSQPRAESLCPPPLTTNDGCLLTKSHRRNLLLMATLGCIALLAIGVSLFDRERDRAAARKRAATEIQDIQKAIRQYEMQYGVFPTNALGIPINTTQ
jgi:hypothetical protein